METPKDKRFRQIHDGHCTFHPPAERRFITPEVIEGSHLVGSPAEIAEKIRKAESMGLKEISLLPPMKVFRESMRDFVEVMKVL